MKKSIRAIAGLAILASLSANAAQQPMTQGQFLDLQTKINKDILENPFDQETTILQALDGIESLKGTEPWKTRAKLWAAGARKQLEKAKEAAVAKGMAQMPEPAGRLERGEIPTLPVPGLAQKKETPEIKVMQAKLQSSQLDFEQALKDYLSHLTHYSNGEYTGIRWEGQPLEPQGVSAEVAFERIKKLLDAGVDPNAYMSNKQRPLHFIAQETAKVSEEQFRKGIRPLLELLVDKGAHINERQYESTALMKAASKNNIGATAFLLEHNADITLTDRDGMNALEWAAGFGDGSQVLDILLKHLKKIGREDLIDSQDRYGKTPLMEAAGNYRPESYKNMELLLQAGANPLIKDRSGRNAVDIIRPLLEEFQQLGKNKYYDVRDPIRIVRLEEVESNNINLAKISLLEKYIQEWKELQRKQVPELVGKTEAPPGKAFTEEAPLGGEPAGIVRGYLLGEPEKKKEKTAPAKKGPVSEEEEMEEVD